MSYICTNPQRCNLPLDKLLHAMYAVETLKQSGANSDLASMAVTLAGCRQIHITTYRENTHMDSNFEVEKSHLREELPMLFIYSANELKYSITKSISKRLLHIRKRSEHCRKSSLDTDHTTQEYVQLPSEIYIASSNCLHCL